jgi:hypothetical protein
MADTQTYDPSEVTLSFNGQPILGFVKASFLPALLPFPCNGVGGWELVEFERLEEVVDGRVHIFGAYVYEHFNEITDETKQISLTRSLGSYSL